MNNIKSYKSQICTTDWAFLVLLKFFKTTKWVTIKFGAQLLHRVEGLSEKGLKYPTGSRFTKGKEYRPYTYETKNQHDMQV